MVVTRWTIPWWRNDDASDTDGSERGLRSSGPVLVGYVHCRDFERGTGMRAPQRVQRGVAVGPRGKEDAPRDAATGLGFMNRRRGEIVERDGDEIG